MSGLILPGRFNSQPQYPAPVDRGHPLARALVHAYYAGFDAAQSRPAAVANSVVTVPSRLGLAQSVSNGASNYIDLGNAIGATGPLTYVTFGQYSATPVAAHQNLVSYGDRAALRLGVTTANEPSFYTFDGANWQEIKLTGVLSWAAGDWYFAAGVHTGSANLVYAAKNGGAISSGSIAANARNSGTHTLRLGRDDEVSRGANVDHALTYIFQRALTASEIASLYRGMWQLFIAPRRVWAVSVASGGGTGSVSITEGDDTVAATGALRISAAASITEADDTLIATGTLRISAAAAVTEADDTASATGTVALRAAASVTESDDTVSGTGTLRIQGAASLTEADDTLSAQGTSVAVTTGTAAITEADDAVSAAGTLRIQAAASVTEAGDTVAANGTLPIAGAASIAEADDSVTSTGGLRVQGAAAVAEADDTAAATGALRIQAAASILEAGDTVVAVGGAPITEPLPVVADVIAFRYAVHDALDFEYTIADTLEAA